MGNRSRTIQIDASGFLGFTIGSVLSQIVYGLGIGVPIVVAVTIAEHTGGSLILTAAIGAAFGAVAVFFIGYAFGAMTQLGPWFAVGAVWVPAVMLIQVLGVLRGSTDAFGALTVGAYSAAGAAMASGFFVGSKRRPGNTESGDLTSASSREPGAVE